MGGGYGQVKILLVLIIPILAIAQDTGMAYENKSATEIALSIKNSNISPIHDANIIGDLDLHGYNISCKIYITNSTFNGKVNFGGSIFNKDVNFSKSIFKDSVDFNRSAFLDNAKFEGAEFDKEVTFRSSKFNKPIYFTESIFNDLADFWKGTFDFAYFVNARFQNADFSFASFNKDVYFTNTSYDGSALFGCAKFDSNFICESSIFNNVTSFQSSKFNNHADFYHTDFTASNFQNVEFFKDVFFSEAQFKNNTQFTESIFNGRTNFTHSNFNEIVDFDRSRFSGNIIGWRYLENKFKSDEATYFTLISNFKDHGQFDDANDCYYSYRFHYMSSPLDYLSFASCGFGVRWLHTIYSGIFCIILFGFVYSFMINQNGSNKYTRIQRILKSIWFSAVVLLSVPSELYPQRSKEYKKYANQIKYHLPILERLIGWGLLLLLINTLSRLMIHY